MSDPSSKTTGKSAQHLEVNQAKKAAESPVDARLSRLTEKVLPSAPYILSSSLPPIEEFVDSHNPLNAINCKKYSLFKPGEEELQYLTFKDRWDDSAVWSMSARGGWDDGKGRIAAPEEPYSRTSSDGTPRPGQAPRKKITLAEYQNKDRSKGTTPASKPAASKPTEDVKTDLKTPVDPEKAEENATSRGIKHHGQKRSADVMVGTKDDPSTAHALSSPSAKKARVSDSLEEQMPKIQEPQPGVPKAAATSDKDEASKNKGLPQKEVSQTEAPKADVSSVTNIHQVNAKSSHPTKTTMSDLPPMLSPLAPAVEAVISRLTSSVRDGKATASKAAEAGTTKNTTSATKQIKSTIPTKGPQEKKRVTSAPRQAAKDVDVKTAVTPVAARNGPPNGSKSVSTPTPTPKSTPPDPPKKMRLRVALKIKKKANRNTLHAYTRMQPTPGRNSLFPNRPIEIVDRPIVPKADIKSNDNEHGPQQSKKPDSKPNQSMAPKTGDKRGSTHLGGDDSGPSKKRKAPGKVLDAQKSGTPKLDQDSAPAVSHLPSAQKHTVSTPNAQANGGTAMLRAASGQGSVNTPLQSTVTGTPAASSAGRRRRSYTSPDKPISPNLRSEAKQYHDTARTLKHEADVYLKKPQKMSDDERKRGLVLGTESVLCFMVAFTLGDTGLSYSDRGSWASILPYLENLQQAAHGVADLDHMSGLLHQLEAVIRDQVAYADMQLLDKNPLKHKLGDAAKDSSVNQEQHKAAEYHKYYQGFHTQVMKAQSAWRTGWLSLDVARLPAQYPRTWENRDEHRFAYGKGRDAIMKGEYTRKYNLPMNNMTSGLEAVNFGLNFLTEWSKSKNVEWKPKLIL